MHVMDQRIFGVLILLLLASLVVVKRATTGSILETPDRRPLLRLVNCFNLFFLLVANPLAAILLITRHIDGADPTFLALAPGWPVMCLEIGGLVVYLTGFVLMGWALLRLGRSYQLGGSVPRRTDALVVSGPYARIRHPMYTAALCIAFGLASLTESLACFGKLVIYLVLILLLIPMEEVTLLRAYGGQYAAYQLSTRRLIPFLF